MKKLILSVFVLASLFFNQSAMATTYTLTDEYLQSITLEKFKTLPPNVKAELISYYDDLDNADNDEPYRRYMLLHPDVRTRVGIAATRRNCADDDDRPIVYVPTRNRNFGKMVALGFLKALAGGGS